MTISASRQASTCMGLTRSSTPPSRAVDSVRTWSHVDVASLTRYD